MKHLLILLISILLLSSPLFGQETGVLYQHESSSGIKWKTFGNGKVQPKYEGEIKNGDMWFILHGLGVITFPFDGKSIIGEWKNGKEWNTKHKNKDGKIIGKFEDGEWILKWGVLYFGFRNGKVGYYTEKWEGFESEDNRDFSKYEGEIKIGFPNGQGILTFPDGEKYEGEFKDGKKNGQGTHTWKDGDKYVGEHKDGKYQGQGTYTWKDGGKYVGEFKDGKYDGQGTHTFPDGGKYLGEFKDGKQNGQGTFTTSDGLKSVGEWKDGERNGQGTITYPDGIKYVGEFKDGELWNGIFYEKNGNIIEKWVNGVKQ